MVDEGGRRRCLALLLALQASGCSIRLFEIPPPPPATCSTTVTAVDAGVPSCAAPVSIDPDEVVDLESFRRLGSLAVCDWSFECGWDPFTTSFCHPGFAALHARRGGGDPPVFDVENGRMCVRALRDAPGCSTALGAALRCLGLSGGALGFGPGSICSRDLDCGQDARCVAGACAYRREGDPCTDQCGPGLVCDGRVCMPGAACNAECPASVCGSGLQCAAGRCSLSRPGQACGQADCTRGLVCPNVLFPACVVPSAVGAPCGPRQPCAHGACEDGTCIARGRIGCACERDANCPAEVSTCAAGICVARPVEGDPCTAGGPACLGAVCEGGVCRAFRLGEAGCVGDGECDGDLVCASGVCGPVLREGDACVAVPGRCAPDLYCETTGVCVQPAGPGERCLDPCPDTPCRRCAPDLRCSPGGICF